eukprot:TRINITY_DN7377_c0_g1_i2.p1 TRINITY_DN7377_c0_g1~~TRINITY_DN7377_c0_g1_i2.p1  ORF type:complete len:516 (+),score=125.31 TRINITY_DN7377_c0_g1_i2:80-1627(+)
MRDACTRRDTAASLQQQQQQQQSPLLPQLGARSGSSSSRIAEGATVRSSSGNRAQSDSKQPGPLSASQCAPVPPGLQTPAACTPKRLAAPEDDDRTSCDSMPPALTRGHLAGLRNSMPLLPPPAPTAAEPTSPSAASADFTERVLIALDGGDDWELQGSPSRRVPDSARELFARMLEISQPQPARGTAARLSRTQLLDCLLEIEIRERVRRSPLRAMVYRRNFDRVWRQMAPGGAVTEADFVRFAKRASLQRRQFLTMRALVRWRAFWGLGQIGAHADPMGLVSRGCIPRGLLDDYLFYIENNHSLVSIWTADPAHPFERRERVVTEMVTLGFSFLMSGASGQWAPAGLLGWLWGSGWAAGFLFVTLPCYCLWWMLWLLQACPCLLTDPENSSRRSVDCGRKLEVAGRLAASIVLGLGIAFWGMGACLYLIDYTPGHVTGELAISEQARHRLWLWVLARVDAYLLMFPFYFLVYFNPCASLAPSGKGCCARALRWVGVAQWRHERDRCFSVVPHV